MSHVESEVPFTVFELSSSFGAVVDELATLGDDVPEAFCLAVAAATGSASLAVGATVFSASRGVSVSGLFWLACAVVSLFCSSGLEAPLFGSAEVGFTDGCVEDMPFAAWAYENVAAILTFLVEKKNEEKEKLGGNNQVCPF